MLLEDYISHRIPRILRFSSIDVSYASVFEPTEFVASSATTAGAVFTKTSDTSLWVLRAKLRNSSSDSAHCMGKSVDFVDFVWDNIFHLMLINSSTDSNKMKHDFIPCGCELSFYKNQFYHVSSVDKGNLSLNSNLSSLIELISTSCFHPSAIVRSCEWPSSEEMYC